MRDLHQVIIDHIGHMIGGHAVCLEEHLVIELLRLKGNRSPDFILKRNGTARIHLEPDHIRCRYIYQCLDLFRFERQAVFHRTPRGGIILR